jgi:hypothetical protein
MIDQTMEWSKLGAERLMLVFFSFLSPSNQTLSRYSKVTESAQGIVDSIHYNCEL